MATVGGFSRHHHLDELDEPLDSAEGVLSPNARRDRVLANIMQRDAVVADVGTFETVSGMVGETFFDGARYRTRFTCTAVVIGTLLVDDATAHADGTLLYTFPPTVAIAVLGGFISGTLLSAASVLTDTPEVGLGSVLAAGANATLGAQAATTEDILGPFVAASLNNGVVKGVNATSGIHQIAGGGVKTVHLNAADTWADVAADAAVSFTGVIEIEWIKVS